MYDNGVTYMFIQHNNVFLMVASRQNCNAASLLLFLHRVVDVSYLLIITSLKELFFSLSEYKVEIADFFFVLYV